jgi:hypothetical protein
VVACIYERASKSGYIACLNNYFFSPHLDSYLTSFHSRYSTASILTVLGIQDDDNGSIFLLLQTLTRAEPPEDGALVWVHLPSIDCYALSRLLVILHNTVIEISSELHCPSSLRFPLLGPSDPAPKNFKTNRCRLDTLPNTLFHTHPIPPSYLSQSGILLEPTYAPKTSSPAPPKSSSRIRRRLHTYSLLIP